MVSEAPVFSSIFYHLLQQSLAPRNCFNNFGFLLKQFARDFKCFKLTPIRGMFFDIIIQDVEANPKKHQRLQHFCRRLLRSCPVGEMPAGVPAGEAAAREAQWEMSPKQMGRAPDWRPPLPYKSCRTVLAQYLLSTCLLLTYYKFRFLPARQCSRPSPESGGQCPHLW